MERLAGGLTKTQAGAAYFLMVNFKVPHGDGLMGEVQGRSASFPTGVKEVGSSSLLVIQVHGSEIATSQERVVNWKILVNQWGSEHSFHDELSHHLVFTKTDDEPTSFTPVENSADSPEPLLRTSPTTGYDAEMLEV